MAVRSKAASLLRSWVRIPPGAWIFVCCECCVLSVRGLCDELITHTEESYRMWCVVVCDLETSRMRRPWLALGRSATAKKKRRFPVARTSMFSTKKVTCWRSNMLGEEKWKKAQHFGWMIKRKEHSLKQTDNGKTRDIFTNIKKKDLTSKSFTAIRVWFKRFRGPPYLHSLPIIDEAARADTRAAREFPARLIASKQRGKCLFEFVFNP